MYDCFIPQPAARCPHRGRRGAGAEQMGLRHELCGDDAAGHFIWYDESRLQTTRCFASIFTIPTYIGLGIWLWRRHRGWWPPLICLTSQVVRAACLALSLLPLGCLAGNAEVPLVVWLELAARVLWWLMLAFSGAEAEWELGMFVVPIITLPRFWTAVLRLHDGWNAGAFAEVVEWPACLVLLFSLALVRARVFPTALLDDAVGQQWQRASPLQRIFFGWCGPGRLRPRNAAPLATDGLAALPRRLRPAAAAEHLQLFWEARWVQSRDEVGGRQLAETLLEATKGARGALYRLAHDSAMLASFEFAARTADQVGYGMQHWAVLHAVGLAALLAALAVLRSHCHFGAATAALHSHAALLGALCRQTLVLRLCDRRDRAPLRGFRALSGPDTAAAVAFTSSAQDLWALPLGLTAAALLLWRRAGWGAAAGCGVLALCAVCCELLRNVPSLGRRQQRRSAPSSATVPLLPIQGQSGPAPSGGFNSAAVAKGMAEGIAAAAPLLALAALCAAAPDRGLSPGSAVGCGLLLRYAAACATSFPTVYAAAAAAAGPLERVAAYLVPAPADSDSRVESWAPNAPSPSASGSESEHSTEWGTRSRWSVAPGAGGPGDPLGEQAYVSLEGASFITSRWQGDYSRTGPALTHASLRLCPGDRLGVLGDAGAGKSLLLLALAGELRMIEGSREVKPAAVIAYAPPRPVVQWGRSLMDNVVAGHPLSRRRYAAVMRACVLPHSAREADAELRRAELSACAQARIALARALYRPAQVVLLDDPFASMEPRVAEQVSRRLFARDGPLGTAACAVAAPPVREWLIRRGCVTLVRIAGGCLRPIELTPRTAALRAMVAAAIACIRVVIEERPPPRSPSRAESEASSPHGKQRHLGLRLEPVPSGDFGTSGLARGGSIAGRLSSMVGIASGAGAGGGHTSPRVPPRTARQVQLPVAAAENSEQARWRGLHPDALAPVPAAVAQRCLQELERRDHARPLPDGSLCEAASTVPSQAQAEAAAIPAAAQQSDSAEAAASDDVSSGRLPAEGVQPEAAAWQPPAPPTAPSALRLLWTIYPSTARGWLLAAAAAALAAQGLAAAASFAIWHWAEWGGGGIGLGGAAGEALGQLAAAALAAGGASAAARAATDVLHGRGAVRGEMGGGGPRPPLGKAAAAAAEEQPCGLFPPRAAAAVGSGTAAAVAALVCCITDPLTAAGLVPLAIAVALSCRPLQRAHCELRRLADASAAAPTEHAAETWDGALVLRRSGPSRHTEDLQRTLTPHFRAGFTAAGLRQWAALRLGVFQAAAVLVVAACAAADSASASWTGLRTETVAALRIYLAVSADLPAAVLAAIDAGGVAVECMQEAAPKQPRRRSGVKPGSEFGDMHSLSTMRSARLNIQPV
eukprot:TRINITY_DN8555_c0_g1_i1.p1 TRINITY_DN8555_c0_g1~~TRINITY_DN8555_c0_g1_i1.p1  ORF type:complete len:1383 (+),score=339.70 TRINITY_DN8555_c0_g1_i1:37-4185(+)